jgi:hypothetical protein
MSLLAEDDDVALYKLAQPASSGVSQSLARDDWALPRQMVQLAIDQFSLPHTDCISIYIIYNLMYTFIP